MAYNKTTWTNDSGQSLNEDNLNKIETGIDEAHTTIASLESDVDALEAIDAGTRLDVLENTGITVLTGANLAEQTIAVTATKVTSFDTLSIEKGSCTEGSIANQKATATCSGVFKLRYEAFVAYSSSADITWQLYKNGAAFGQSTTINGKNTSAIPVVLLATLEAIADDYFELYATSSLETDMTISQAIGTMEKTQWQ